MQTVANSALVFCALVCTASLAAAQTPVGALAIDEHQGDQYGWAVDYEAAGAAQAAALRECGGGCRVVLTFNRCAAYAADHHADSTAVGWAESFASSSAQQAALSECSSRGGRGCLVRVWGCNGPVVEEGLGLDRAARADARPQPGAVFRDCEVCPEMVVMPDGRLALGRYEVTVGEYRAFASATGGGGDGCVFGDSWQNPSFSQTDRHPVTCVSWDDAQAYVSWLSRTTGATYRLPTDAEWERAATSSQRGCDEGRTGNRGTCPVGSYGANGVGLSDMVGNLWEWTEDCAVACCAAAPGATSRSSGGPARASGSAPAAGTTTPVSVSRGPSTSKPRITPAGRCRRMLVRPEADLPRHGDAGAVQRLDAVHQGGAVLLPPVDDAGFRVGVRGGVEQLPCRISVLKCAVPRRHPSEAAVNPARQLSRQPVAVVNAEQGHRRPDVPVVDRVVKEAAPVRRRPNTGQAGRRRPSLRGSSPQALPHGDRTADCRGGRRPCPVDLAPGASRRRRCEPQRPASDRASGLSILPRAAAAAPARSAAGFVVEHIARRLASGP